MISFLIGTVYQIGLILYIVFDTLILIIYTLMFLNNTGNVRDDIVEIAEAKGKLVVTLLLFWQMLICPIWLILNHFINKGGDDK